VVYLAGSLQITAEKERVMDRQMERLQKAGCGIYLSIDADVVHERDVPGVSAPNPMRLPGQEITAAEKMAGMNPYISSLDLVEVNAVVDAQGQTARWAALVIWSFLLGLTLGRSNK